MPFKEPFRLGPFWIDAEGRLVPAQRDLSPGFSVRWHGRIVHARLSSTESREAGRLLIRSSLGRIPSTASNPAIRAAAFATLRGLLSEIPEAWKVRLLPDHQPQVEMEGEVALPITVATLVTELTAFLIDLSPFLDLMDQVGAGAEPLRTSGVTS